MWKAIEIMKDPGIKGNIGAKEVLSSLEHLEDTLYPFLKDDPEPNIMLSKKSSGSGFQRKL